MTRPRRMGLGRLSIRWRIAIGTVLIAAVLAVGAVVAFRAQVTRILDTTTTTLGRRLDRRNATPTKEP